MIAQERFDSILSGIDTGSKVLLAVSGGVDSMVLASLFLNSDLRIPFEVAHCNFHLRGAESDSDEALVRKWCERNGIHLHVQDFSTAEYSEKMGVSIEMAARELRYAWFSELSTEHGFDVVTVAHNANDNAETLVLNLLRGTGLKGICGMSRIARMPLDGDLKVRLFRPLLQFSREEILEYAHTNGLEWHEDSTNADSKYKRNCIRNEVFPVFSRINPSFLETLNEDMVRFARERKAADCFVKLSAGEVLLPCRPGELLRVDASQLFSQPLYEYLLFRLLEPLGFAPSVSAAIASMHENGGLVSGKSFLGTKGKLVVSDNCLIVGALPAEAAETSLVFSGPGEYAVAGTSFTIKAEPWNALMRVRQPVGRIVMDASKISFPLIVRTWREGDWMCPLGLKSGNGQPGRKKLSDVFVDLKWSILDKERALVVVPSSDGRRIVGGRTDGGKRVSALLWERIDESVKVDEKTTSVIVIERGSF
jgi:tRNA(Ile)-lysidine synthetase, N-terminal domain